MKIANLKMATKLWLAVALIIGALLGVIGFSAYRSAAVQAESDRQTAAYAARIDKATRWAGLTQANSARTYSILLSADPALAVALKEAIANTTAQIGELQKAIEAVADEPSDKAQLAKIAASRKVMLDLREQGRQLRAAGQADEVVQLANGPFKTALATYLGDLNDFVTLQHQHAQASQQRIGESRLFTVKVAAVCIALIVIAILWGAYGLIRSIVKPLSQANRLAARIAEGDLSSTLETDRQDEFGELLRSLVAMSQSLAQTVSRVRQSTDSIALASSEIAAGNNDLSMRTEQTSSNLQQSASALDNLTNTVQHSAQSAQQASSLAASASLVAEKGGAVVQQVVSTMDEIQTSSKRIADIIGVIDGIAFQTNILALNAAVEAARAGEQGRGFAVVAGEVRSLAQRSAEAAREIKTLISASVERVENGTRLVTDAGQTMGDIVSSVRRVTDMIGEITAAANEQSGGIANVNQAVASLDQMTQQNAALVEQSAAAAQSLREQAEQLAQVVGTFKVAGQAASLAPLRSAPARAPNIQVPQPAKPLARSAPAPALSAAKTAKAPAPAAPRIASAPAGGAQDDWESF
ncbi:MAG: MCP four helix bundle domain-containing protein [Curvibacter lanceolatus]|jgi:methyl-accepting chemotaxis protein|uniref:methyl-accepting chemotaxis protein n=1 Tax=Curvibacter lanceolatus TaxID=86182 RepID=UPI002355D006|nr:methyl-accepting chemotaxis protein [Curvibacter lanceolatus]MBV5290991.1 MCP four helix bundle domain-containing protein [Curvibacter lanceolatus]